MGPYLGQVRRKAQTHEASQCKVPGRPRKVGYYLGSGIEWLLEPSNLPNPDPSPDIQALIRKL